MPSRLYAQTTVESPDVSGFRTFATWPDDAQVLDPRTAIVSISLSNWHWAFGHGVSVPTLFGVAAVTRRVQMSASFERDRSTYTDHTRLTRVGDSYLVGKIAIVSPELHRIGLAVSPLLQILGNDSLTYYRYYKSESTRRAQWALPVHVQFPLGRVRTSVSGGYFSVGSSFASGSGEMAITSRFIVNGTVSQAFSHETSELIDATVKRHRTDASGGAWVILSPSAFVFGSIGRTISRTDQNSMTLLANVGLAVLLGRRP